MTGKMKQRKTDNWTPFVLIARFCLCFLLCRYLIEIQSVNAKVKQARIMYTDGSTEELDLDEIIRDGHMSLITQ